MSGKKLRGKSDVLADVDDYEMGFEMNEYELDEIEKLDFGIEEDYSDWDDYDFDGGF